jgi:hypothetical protein
MKNVNSVVNIYLSVNPALLQGMQEAEDDSTKNISTADQPGILRDTLSCKRDQLSTF